MNLIGHRGRVGTHPENTLRAVRNAVRHVDMIEFDVRRCASGELVIFHDNSLARLTDGEGEVSDTELEALQELEILDSGETIPTLEALLDVVPPSVGLNVELKVSGLAADALSLVEPLDHELIVSSFDPDHIREVRATSPTVATALLFSTRPERNLDRADALGCEYVHPRDTCCDGTDLVTRAHDRGFRVNVWPVKSANVARQLYEDGVDGLIIDDLETVGFLDAYPTGGGCESS